jgi:archaeosine synthase alpha-subunit
MLEILDRGGLGRTGIWSRGDRSLRTPTVLYLHTAARSAPDFAEALFVDDRTEDPRFQLRIRGSFFRPRESDGGDELPLTKGLPRSVSELELTLGPVQGGFALITSDADIEAAKGAHVAFLANGPEFARDPRDFADTVAGFRERVGASVLLGVTGLAMPSNLAVLVYAGIDLVDSSRMQLDTARGLFHTSDGIQPVREVDRNACGCPPCIGGGDPGAHNDLAMQREMLLVRNELAHGRLRELVERRLANDPWNTAVLRHLDLRQYDIVERYSPVEGPGLLAYSHESLTRPEIVRFRRRILSRFVKPPSARVLLLLPCSARKPYSSSRSHRKFRDAILASGNPGCVHEVIVTSPLGLIPRELERFFPARDYDIPVTGDWNRDEATLVTEDLHAFVEANRYDAVVAHLGSESPIVMSALPHAIPTAKGHPTSEPSLLSLAKVLRELTSALGPVPKARRFAETMASIARFQFGEAGLGLVEGAEFRGRFPDVHILRNGRQVAMHTARGLLSLTLDGGTILSAANAYNVEIEDFVPKGNVFAVGVTDAADEIRVGDDVVVRHAGDVRAVGSARMSGREMRDAERGEAVRVRHVAAPKG